MNKVSCNINFKKATLDKRPPYYAFMFIVHCLIVFAIFYYQIDLEYYWFATWFIINGIANLAAFIILTQQQKALKQKIAEDLDKGCDDFLNDIKGSL